MDANLTAMKLHTELKNPMVGLILAFFFGCIGMIYSTPRGAVIMAIPTIISAMLCFFFIGFPMLIFCNIVSCAWAYNSCTTHNKNLYAELEQNQSKAA